MSALTTNSVPRREAIASAFRAVGLTALSGAALEARQQADRNAPISPKDNLKITKLEIIPVQSLRSIFIKMYTDAGIIGIGEGTVEGRIATVVAAIQQIEPYLVGKDPRAPAHHWQAIYRHAFYRGDIILTSALGAVDIAMWDIKARPWACRSMNCWVGRRATASAAMARPKAWKRPRATCWPRASSR